MRTSVQIIQNRLLIIFIIIIPITLFGQRKEIPINVSMFNESTAIPYTKFLTKPIHPGIQLGTEFNYNSKIQTRLFQTINVSYFHHKHLNQGVGINTELGIEYRSRLGLAASGLIGVGYMHTFATTEEFIFENGGYVKKADQGNARLFPSFSLDLGYYLGKSKNSPKIFVRYQSWAEYPYSPGFIPVMTHINLHIGAKIFIRKKKI